MQSLRVAVPPPPSSSSTTTSTPRQQPQQPQQQPQQPSSPSAGSIGAAADSSSSSTPSPSQTPVSPRRVAGFPPYYPIYYQSGYPSLMGPQTMGGAVGGIPIPMPAPAGAQRNDEQQQQQQQHFYIPQQLHHHHQQQQQSALLTHCETIRRQLEEQLRARDMELKKMRAELVRARRDSGLNRREADAFKTLYAALKLENDQNSQNNDPSDNNNNNNMSGPQHNSRGCVVSVKPLNADIY